jgi:hypothetical protein
MDTNLKIILSNSEYLCKVIKTPQNEDTEKYMSASINVSTTDCIAVTLLSYIQTQQPLTKIFVASAMAEGAISSKFSMLHSSKNSRIGEGCDPTEM